VTPAIAYGVVLFLGMLIGLLFPLVGTAYSVLSLKLGGNQG
jgi:hypothetical protein